MKQKWLLQKWRALVEQTSCHGQLLSGADLAKNVVNDSPFKNAWARSILEDADNVRRLGTDGRWQHVTLCKEEVELFAAQQWLALQRCADAPSPQCGEVRRLGKVLGNILEETASSAHGQVRE